MHTCELNLGAIDAAIQPAGEDASVAKSARRWPDDEIHGVPYGPWPGLLAANACDTCAFDLCWAELLRPLLIFTVVIMGGALILFPA